MKNPINFIRANVLLIAILTIVIIGLTLSILHDTNESNLKIVSLCDTNKVISVKVPMHEFKSSELYKKNCKFCHGTYGKGDGIKARRDSTLCPYDLSKEQKADTVVYWTIANGQNKMPSHEEKLSDTNIQVLVIYIKRFKTK